ncbi:hypothetical protein NLI96_g8796 [Meripilus lineatus]|uniref:Uncharacterized protein n=1 Tax=Meripilus lineatus TaxID=2056292 RepID=A0AAD5UYY5_9APHY|nr:hypothetical protein NLI96_g8796 [Physisporinus lineatus]
MGQFCCHGTYKPSEDDEVVLPSVQPPSRPDPPEKDPPRFETTMDTSKTFTIYTSTTDPRKTLNHQAQILLTVTPRDQSNLFITQTPLAWKVFDFPPQSDMQVQIKWHSEFVSLCSIPVSPGQSGVLAMQGGGAVWENIQGQQRTKLTARNETAVPQTFTLGSVDEEDNFEGFVRFTPTPSGGAIIADPAVMLQIYTVTNYKQGQTLSQVDSAAFLLKKYNQQAGPIDLTTLPAGKSLLLSSGPTGRLTLE